MDKIDTYQNIIVSLLEGYASVKPANLSAHEYQVIVDTQHHHYQLLSLGWQSNKYYHNVMLHLDIKPNAKIWLQANNTDWDIANSLLENGIPQSDIVIGMISPNLRAYSGYAVS
jgi:hypothetical protein